MSSVDRFEVTRTKAWAIMVGLLALALYNADLAGLVLSIIPTANGLIAVMRRRIQLGGGKGSTLRTVHTGWEAVGFGVLLIVIGVGFSYMAISRLLRTETSVSASSE
jgi:hypothetical protein